MAAAVAVTLCVVAVAVVVVMLAVAVALAVGAVGAVDQQVDHAPLQMSPGQKLQTFLISALGSFLLQYL